MNTGLGNSVTGLLEPEFPHTTEYMLLPGTLTFLLIIPLKHIFTFSHSSRNPWFNLQIFASFILPQIPYPTNKILTPLHCFFCLFLIYLSSPSLYYIHYIMLYYIMPVSPIQSGTVFWVYSQALHSMHCVKAIGRCPKHRAQFNEQGPLEQFTNISCVSCNLSKI